MDLVGVLSKSVGEKWWGMICSVMKAWKGHAISASLGWTGQAATASYCQFQLGYSLAVFQPMVVS
jgi:hypothetical protein